MVPGFRQLCAFDDVSDSSNEGRHRANVGLERGFRTDLPDLGVAMVEELD